MRLNFSPLLARKARLFGRLAPRLTELLRYEASVFHRKSVGCRPRGPRFRIGMGNPYADRFHVRSLRETRLTVRKSRGFAANIAGRNLRAQVLKVKRRAERYGRYPYRSVQNLRFFFSKICRLFCEFCNCCSIGFPQKNGAHVSDVRDISCFFTHKLRVAEFAADASDFLGRNRVFGMSGCGNGRR